MLSALYTSSSALNASEEWLNVVGNNLANSNTTGFKSQTVGFANQFSEVLLGASQPTATSGGTDPVQIGNGVSVASTVTNNSQGTITPTGNPLDVAIQNSGYFIVSKDGNTFYTRDGALSVDSNNNLVNTATGAIVQRVGSVGEATPTSPAFQMPGNKNIKIPNGITIPGEATQNVNFTGNLSPSLPGPTSQVLSIGASLTVNGKPATASTLLNNLDQTTKPYAAGDTIVLTGTTVDGAPVSAAYTITGTATDTVGALLTSINQAFESNTPSLGATAAINSIGGISLTANTAGPSSMSLAISSSGTGSTNFGGFLTTTPGSAGGTVTSEAQIYDTQGVAHNLTFTFQKAAANQWNVTASMNSGDGTITGFGQDNEVAGLTFNQNGSFNGVIGTNATELQLSKTPYTVAGAPATGATLLNSLDQTKTGFVAGDSIAIAGKDYNGNQVSSTLSVDGTTTLQDLVDKINSTFTGGVASIDASGNLQFAATNSGQTPLSLQLSDSVGDTGQMNFASMTEVTRGVSGDSNIIFQLNNLAGTAAPQAIRLSFGTTGGFDGISQAGTATGGSSVSVASQDGYGTGTLVSESINPNGIINGEFSNGKTLALAQIALATFSNPQSLLQLGNNLLQSSVNSGLPTISAPSVGGAGSLQSNSLEGSNVNTSNEFTNLIAAQRLYEINAKAFSAANTLMQATVNLIQ